MGNNKFRETLERLHGQLENAEPLDDETRQLLSHVDSDIQELLEPDVSEPTGTHRSLNSQLDKAIGNIESEYPELANTMRQIMTTLANMGI